MLKKLYYKIFKHYEVIETKFVPYQNGDKMIRETHDKPEAERWVLAKEEDTNRAIGMVYLYRKRRVTFQQKYERILTMKIELTKLFSVASLFVLSVAVRPYLLKRYKLKKKLTGIWFAGYYVNKQEFPPYFDKDRQYIRYKVGDSVPFLKLHDGKIAFYTISEIVFGKNGDDHAGWDDNKHYDLQFDIIRTHID